MARQTTTKEPAISQPQDPQSQTAVETALMQPTPQNAMTAESQYVDHTLLNNEVAVAEAMEAAAAMEMSFVTYTKPEELFAKSNDGVRFNITGAVTVTINDRDPKAKNPTKPVHVFRLESVGDIESGFEYYTMMGVNPVRDRIADGFFKNMLIGIQMTAGPIRIGQVKVQAWPQPAWTLQADKGFRIVRKPAAARISA